MAVTAQDIDDYHLVTEKSLNQLRVHVRYAQKQIRETKPDAALEALGQMDQLISELGHSNNDLWQGLHSTTIPADETHVGWEG